MMVFQFLLFTNLFLKHTKKVTMKHSPPKEKKNFTPPILHTRTDMNVKWQCNCHQMDIISNMFFLQWVTLSESIALSKTKEKSS